MACAPRVAWPRPLPAMLVAPRAPNRILRIRRKHVNPARDALNHIRTSTYSDPVYADAPWTHIVAVSLRLKNSDGETGCDSTPKTDPPHSSCGARSESFVAPTSDVFGVEYSLRTVHLPGAKEMVDGPKLSPSANAQIAKRPPSL